MLHLMFVHYTFSSVCVAEWSPFEKNAAKCSHCLLSICIYYLFPILVLRAGFGLFAPVPVHCCSIT